MAVPIQNSKCAEKSGALASAANGVVVNISSTAGITTTPAGRPAHYAMTKAALAHFTRYIASEVGPHGIRVNRVAPGIMLTCRVTAQSTARGIGTR